MVSIAILVEVQLMIASIYLTDEMALKIVTGKPRAGITTVYTTLSEEEEENICGPNLCLIKAHYL